MMKLTTFAILLLFFLTGCTQADPNPELSDPVYRDLKKELTLAEESLAFAKEELLARQEGLRNVVPQTGQIKTLQNKVFQAESEIARLNQQRLFFEISVEQRRLHVNTRYADSLRGGNPWPDKKELQDFEKAQKFQREKIAWEKNKGVVKDVPRGTKEPNTN